MRLTSLELQTKSTADANMIALYKKQIAQLAACISDREGRIERRKPIIEKITLREQAAFNADLDKASEPGNLLVGETYYAKAGMFTVVQDADRYVVVNLQTGSLAITGKDLSLVSQVFFYDCPDAKVFQASVDK